MYLGTTEALMIMLVVLGLFAAVLVWVLVRLLVEWLLTTPQLDRRSHGSGALFIPPQAKVWSEDSSDDGTLARPV